MTDLPPLSGLPAGVRGRYVDGVNGLRVHLLEAGFETPDRPCLLLLHGFPELAYSWRKVMPALAAAGYHVVAPDQRGYGRTSGADTRYDGDVGQFSYLNLVRDAVVLIAALGRSSVTAVIGHDFGSPVAAHCALIRPGAAPGRLAGWAAAELARMPRYYVMGLDEDMPAAVAPQMPTPAEVAACAWLPDAELAVYAAEFARTGFQGGLQWYRAGTGGLNTRDMTLFTGRAIEVPALFIAGASDWGVYQAPGALEAMQTQGCADLRGCHLLEGAGHWVQQEQPEAVSTRLLDFLSGLARD